MVLFYACYLNLKLICYHNRYDLRVHICTNKSYVKPHATHDAIIKSAISCGMFYLFKEYSIRTMLLLKSVSTLNAVVIRYRQTRIFL